MSNRAAKYEQLHKSLKKHFKLASEPGERTVLEHLVYACCLEEAKAEQADEAFAKLQQAYFDWNEVRVTTVIELGEALNSLPNPTQAGHRIKRCLQSLFEGRYQYDIEDMKKANLSKATEEIGAWKGVSPFILNYVSQNALGGHAIPTDGFAIEMLVQLEILTSVEAEKKVAQGVERAIPKGKGFEFGSLLHQLAVEFHQHPKNASVAAVFKDFGLSPKAKAPPKPAPKKEVKPALPVPEVVGPKTKSKGAEESAAKTATKTAAKGESIKLASKADNVKTESVKTGSVKTGSVKAGSVKAESVKAESVKAESVKPDTVKPDTVKPDTVKPDTVKPDTKGKVTNSLPSTKPGPGLVETKKKPEAKSAEAKPAEVKKTEAKKPELKKPELKQPESKKTETKKSEAKPAEPKTSVKMVGEKSATAKPATKKADDKPQKNANSELNKEKPVVHKKDDAESKSKPTAKPESAGKVTKKKPR